MNTLHSSEMIWAWYPVLSLATGILVIAAICEFAARRMSHARHQRGAWQVAIIAVLALCALELSGGTPRLLSAVYPNFPIAEDIASEPVVETSSTISTPHEADSPNDTDTQRGEQVPHRVELVSDLPTLPETSDRAAHKTNPKRRITGKDVRWPSEAVATISDPQATASQGHRPASHSHDFRKSPDSPISTTEETVPTEAIRSPVNPEKEHAVDSPRNESATTQSAGPAIPPVTPPSSTSSASSSATSLVLGGVLLAWACITVVLLLRIVIGRVRLFWFRRRLPRVTNADLLECVRRLRKRFTLGRRIELRYSNAVGAPIAFGIWRPTIVLPTGFEQQTTREQHEVVLAHEVTHLAGGDSAWQLVADIAAAILWWHPVAWLMRRRLHAACEWVADESCSIVPHGADILAECLVEIGKTMRPARRLAWLGAEGSDCRSALAKRVERLLNQQTNKRHAFGRRGSTSGKILLALVLTASVLFCTAWARPGVRTSEGAEDMNSTLSNWKQCVAAAVVAVWGTVDANSAQAVEADVPQPTHLVYYDGDEDEEQHRDRGRDRDRDERDRPDADRDREHRDGEHRDRPDPERLMHKFREKIETLKRESHKIRQRLENVKNRDSDDAQHMERKLHEIEIVMKRTRRAADDTERMLHQKAVGRRIEELNREHERLKRAGREEEAQRVANEAREIMRTVERERERPRREDPDRERRRDGDRDRDGQRKEAHRRLEHLHRAIENLREGGLEEQAERLEAQAERLERELRGRAEHDRPEDRDHREGEPREHLQREVHELREEVQDLRHELRELRHVLREVIEELDEDDDEDE